MTIAFTGTDGLFTRIGAIGNLLSDTNAFQLNTIPADIQEIIDQFTANNDLVMIDGIETQAAGAQNSAGTIFGFLQSSAAAVVNTMVYQDNPLLSNTNTNASIAEVIRQMQATSESVKACTIGSTVTPGASNLGDGVCVVSTLRADGLVQENSFAENITVGCVADSSADSALAGREQFTVTGVVPYTPFDWRWPGGSAGQTFLAAVPGSADNTSGNLTTNGDFETWTVTNVPDNWSILVGSAGTTIFESTGQFYTGAASLNFLGNGSELTSVAQVFGDGTTGTAGQLVRQTQYACNLWLKVSSVPAAGVLQVSLVDGTNTIINDEEGTPNSFTFTLTGATTSWVAHSGVFRTPYIMPTTVKLRVRLSTALTNTVNLYLDRVGLTQMTQVYAGGPSVAVFSGADDFYFPDYFTCAITNNRGGASENRNFQTLWNRLFNMAQIGLLLPSAGSPTVPDSLIN